MFLARPTLWSYLVLCFQRAGDAGASLKDKSRREWKVPFNLNSVETKFQLAGSDCGAAFLDSGNQPDHQRDSNNQRRRLHSGVLYISWFQSGLTNASLALMPQNKRRSISTVTTGDNLDRNGCSAARKHALHGT